LPDDQKENYSFECGKPRTFTAPIAAQCYCGATCRVVLVRLYNCSALQ
jgi:hypothetical protein